MKRHQFNEKQIRGILEQLEEGMKVAELCKAHGVSPASIYRWRSRFSGSSTNAKGRLWQIEDENQRLKLLVADLFLDREALRSAVRRRGFHSAKVMRGFDH